MLNIHFFPGTAPCNLIDKQYLSNEMIILAFKKIQETSLEYTHFQNIYVYSNDKHLTDNLYHEGDIIIAGSAGGKRADKFIKYHHIKNPNIIAFEAIGLENYGKNVWQFISENGNAYASSRQVILTWDDKTIGHNSYMIHPEKEMILNVNDSVKIGELKADAGDKKTGYFYLFPQVIISRLNTPNSKILNNVLIRCTNDGTIIIPKNPYEQSTIIIDVIVKAAYARQKSDLNLMPASFAAHEIKVT